MLVRGADHGVAQLPTVERCAHRSPVAPVTVIAFYLGAYLLMTLLAFLVMSTMRKVQVSEEIDSYRGLAKRSPFLAFALLIAMASLAGIPLTAGFFGKFFVFQLAIAQQEWLLVVIGLIGAGAGFYYYLKVAASMYLSDADKNADTSAIEISPLSRVTMIALIVAILAAAFAPGLIFGLMQ